MAAEEEDEVDIEGLEDDGRITDYKDIIENNHDNHFNSKANLESTTGSFYSEFCDSSTWCLDPNSVLSLDHCEDEKSRAAIEKMIMEEELYSHGYGRMLEVPTTPIQSGKSKSSVMTKKVHVSPKPKKCHVNAENPSSTHRKPWTKEEQEMFAQGLAKYGRSWTRIASMIDSRTVLQVKNYANQYFKNKDKTQVILPSKANAHTINGQSFLVPSTSGTLSSVVIDTKSRVDTAPLVHIENASDEEEVEVDIDGDSEEEMASKHNTEATDDVYEALLKSVSDTEGCPIEPEESAESKIGCHLNSDDHNIDVAKETTGNDQREIQDVLGCENDKSHSYDVGCQITHKDRKDKNDDDNDVCKVTENAMNDELETVTQTNEVVTENTAVKTENLFSKQENEYEKHLGKIYQSKKEKVASNLSKELGISGNVSEVNQADICARESRKGGLQSYTTVGEVTSNVETSTEDRRLPSLENIKVHTDLILVKDQIHDLEKEFNQEFFMGRSLKTPHRYIKIRNHILDMWEKNKPNYLYKTSVRSGLRNCGDVNSIGRVHAFLEVIGAINVGCSERPRPRPRQIYEPDKVEETLPMESWTNFLRPRKRRVKHDGEWVDDSQSEGLTISHFPCEEDEVEPKQVQDRLSPKKPKVYRHKPSYNPFLLVPCKKFPSTSAVPFEVIFQSDALVVIDVHAHLSTTEVIGLLGGTYCATQRVLKILRAAPCKSLSTGMQCEMDPVSQTQASEELSSKGLSVVGWYHSHPTFAPSPSVRDIETQGKFQEWFGKGGAPFIGVIASPYNYNNTSNQSQITTLTVSDEWETAGQYRLPYQFDYKIQDEATDWINVVDCIDELEVQYQDYKYRMPMTRRYSSSAFTALDKLVDSLRSRLRGSDDEKEDFVSELKNIFTSDLDTWSSERGHENSTKNTEDVV